MASLAIGQSKYTVVGVRGGVDNCRKANMELVYSVFPQVSHLDGPLEAEAIRKLSKRCAKVVKNFIQVATVRRAAL